MSFGAHPRIHQDLFDRILCRRALFRLVGFTHRFYEIRRVIVRDVLQGVCDAVDDVGLLDRGHGACKNYTVSPNLAKSSRSSRFKTLPMALRGSWSKNLSAARRCVLPTLVLNHSVSAFSSMPPVFATTKATGVSPHFSDGTPTTATSATAGCSRNTDSR